MNQDQKPGNMTESRILDRQLDRARVKVGFNPAEMGMAPLSLEVLVPGEPVPVDFFLPILRNETKTIEMIPAAEKGEQYQAEWRKKLLKTEQKRVFIRIEDGDDLMGYFEKNSSTLMNHPGTSLSKKRRVLMEMSSLNLRVLFGSDLDPKSLDNSVKRTNETVTRLINEAQILTRLSEVLSVDYSIYSHSINVSMLAMAFGRYMGMPDTRVQNLGVGGMLHDVGMAKLPSWAMNNPQEFTPQQRAIMRQHPHHGYKMLLPIGAVPYDVLQIVLNHHENADGTGYPSGLKADKTPYLARVVKIADAYDAMTSTRPHQDAKTAMDAAAALLENGIDQFGTDLAPAFVRFLASDAFNE
jgi:HD-GYP domain-containing protein (c-di-GMP phosphodiesterase class II)